MSPRSALLRRGRHACALLVWSMLAAPLSAPSARAAAISVIDDAGRSVQLVAPARRIVTLAPHATELVFDAAAGNLLVGVSEASDFPAAAQNLPQVGGAAGIDLEKILALKPDLVIAWQSGNSRRQIEALAQAGIPVFYSDPKSIEQIASSLERIGQLTGNEAQASARAASFRADMQKLAAAERDKASLSVFYQISERPIFTLGAPHLVSRLIEVCGAHNAYGDVDSLAPEVSSESVVTRHPDLIVTDPGQRAELAQQWQLLGAVPGDGRPHVVGISPDLLTRATPRVLDGTKALCGALDQLRLPVH